MQNFNLEGRQQGGSPQKKKKKNYFVPKFLVASKKIMNRNSTRNKKVKKFQEIIDKRYGAVFKIGQFCIFNLNNN